MIKNLLKNLFKKDSTQETKPLEKPKTVQNASKTPLVVLIVLDGFGIKMREYRKRYYNPFDHLLGYSEDETYGDATFNAKTPFLDTIWSKGKATLMKTSGIDVGLPLFEPGNSEVGHLNIGAGQIVQQSLPKVNSAIETNSFENIKALQDAIKECKKRKSDFHLIGILSAGGVHGHIKHLFTMLDICKKHRINPYVHGFLDGRDAPNMEGYFFVSKLIHKMKTDGYGRLASLSGRAFSMDRDEKWHKTIRAYDCMVGHGERFSDDAFKILQDAYKKYKETDEFFIPTTMTDNLGQPVGKIKDNDVLFFFNFREDRARQLTRIFADPNFSYLPRINFPTNLFIVTMTSYEKELGTHNMFEPHKIETTLADVIADHGLGQIHISETEKTAHVTYFFNGGRKTPHKKEVFFNIPSPLDPDYSKKPEMSAQEITDQVLSELNKYAPEKYSFMLINYANPDMVGHTGDYQATIKANECVDKCVEKVVKKAISLNAHVIIVADHGNCEVMIDPQTKKPDRSHTNNPVPFIILNNPKQIEKDENDKIYKIGIRPDINGPSCILADIAPTILGIMDLPVPDCMNGTDLRESI